MRPLVVLFRVRSAIVRCACALGIVLLLLLWGIWRVTAVVWRIVHGRALPVVLITWIPALLVRSAMLRRVALLAV
jgi:hypothetical protein